MDAEAAVPASLASVEGFRFTQADYIVFIASMVVALIIGLAFGWVGDRQGSTAEFFLGSKQLGAVPIGFSLVASPLTGVFIMGAPSEVYYNGAVYGLLGVSWAVTLLVTVHLFVPIYRRLESPSVYEYLEKRFSTPVRVTAAVIFTLYLCMFLGVVLYVPGIAFSNVTGLPEWFSIAITGLICTKYTVVGGMRGVVWADVYQMVVVVGALLALAVVGGQSAGGPRAAWDAVSQGGRINFQDASLSPFSRHTLWSQCFASVFSWLPVFTTNQMVVQRFKAASSTAYAQIGGYVGLALAELTMLLVVVTGLVMYAHYAGCDPLATCRIRNRDQMVPLFLMDMLGGWPGLPGLFTAAVFAASLSSMSSAINSMAAVCLEDFIKPAMRMRNKEVKENAATILSKAMAFLFGLVSIGLSYVAPFLGETIIQIPITIWGMIAGPLFGTFLLGIFFPFGNSKGAMVGLLGSLALCLWIGVGGIMFGPQATTLPLSADHCPYSNVTQTVLTTPNCTVSTTSPPDLDINSHLYAVYSISYVWRGLIGTIVCLFLGIIVSIITGGCSKANRCRDRDIMHPVGRDCCCCCPTAMRTLCNCGYNDKETVLIETIGDTGIINKGLEETKDEEIT